MIIIPSEFVHPIHIYNNNIYVNTKTGVKILEECHEDEYFDYYLLDENDNKVEDLGSLFSDFGIFEMNSEFGDRVDTNNDLCHGC